MAELGFAGLEAYLQDRYVTRGLVGAAAVRRARRRPWLAGLAACPAGTVRMPIDL
jgi:hypothetical protein